MDDLRLGVDMLTEAAEMGLSFFVEAEVDLM